jgi:alpha-beta hydrolase superfamily lysophospholipase
MRIRYLPLALALAAALLAASPAPARDSHNCVRAGELRFRAADGTRLAGHRFGGLRANGRTTIVLAHQSDGGLCAWVKGARKLVAAGYFVVAFDFRGYGDSKGRQNTVRFAGDYAAAVKAARSVGARKVVLVGASMGGTAALVAAANVRPAVDGVVNLSGPSRYAGLNALAAVSRTAMPVLFVAAEEDLDFADAARELYAAAASERKRLEIFPRGRHGIDLFESTPAVQQLVDEFVRTL